MNRACINKLFLFLKFIFINWSETGMQSQFLLKKIKWTKLRTYHRLHLGKEAQLNDDIIDKSKLICNFIKGSGPGGQNVNKRSNCVQLLYDDIQVKCHSTRSKDDNLLLAKQILREKIIEKQKLMTKV